MNAKVEDPIAKIDLFKWAVVVFLLIGGIIANSYFATQPIALRAIGWIALFGVSVLVAALTAQGQKFWNFLQESRIELRKVIWPTRQETVQATMVVVVMVIGAALILWGVDTLLLHLVGLLTA